MFDSIRQYLQDWSDACEYAAECWPDTPFGNLNQFHIGEPYTALATIAAGCFLIWAVNERRLAKLAHRAEVVDASRHTLGQVIREMKQDAPANKLAA